MLKSSLKVRLSACTLLMICVGCANSGRVVPHRASTEDLVVVDAIMLHGQLTFTTAIENNCLGVPFEDPEPFTHEIPMLELAVPLDVGDFPRARQRLGGERIYNQVILVCDHGQALCSDMLGQNVEVGGELRAFFHSGNQAELYLVVSKINAVD